MNQIKILGSGLAKAAHCIDNDALSKVVDTSDEWIRTRTGIQTRYVSSEENTSDLGYRAACEAIEKANISVQDIDLIIVATMTPDHVTPSTACLIQEKLGLNDKVVMAFDVNAACSGFLYALQVASSMMPQFNKALVIGAETLSKIIDYTDRNTCVLFGDGAGAIIIQNDASVKPLAFYANGYGDVQGILQAKGNALHAPLQNIATSHQYLTMEGSEVFRFAIKAIPEAVYAVLEKANQTIEDIDLIIPHQANLRIIQYVSKKMKVSEDLFFTNLHEFGNTSAASVVIGLAQAQQEGKLKRGMKIVLVGFGAGFTYAASYIEW